MRESNFAFPAQNRACVCITSQLYDRRALDTNAPLPLFNSLTHLTYLTSTSPRIREIMTMDGGLERLVKLLHDFCMCPPPPENAAMLYGLQPPSSHPPKLTPTLNPKSFDKHAAYRFSLAFQSVVNIGVRGSESIRGRVVQAGTLDVVGCILEAWLASKGFAVGPSASMAGQPRETREQRQSRRAAMLEARQREQAAQLARALQVAERTPTERTRRADRALQAQEDETMDVDLAHSGEQPGSRDTDTSTEPSSNTTPVGSNTPTGAVIVPSRDRSGTIIARPVWDQTPTNTTAGQSRRMSRTQSRLPVTVVSDGPSTTHSTDNSRPETETEDDGDVEMDHDGRESDAPQSGASSPERQNPSPERQSTIRATNSHTRRAVGIVSDTTPAPTGASMDLNTDAHIIINDQAVAVDGVGVEDGIVSLETNDDFAMGAPPGAPGAINGPPARADIHTGAGERTPRAGTITLPAPNAPPVPTLPTTAAMRLRHAEGGTVPEQLQRARMRAIGVGAQPTVGGAAGTALGAAAGAGSHHRTHHNRDGESGPYRDEDVLLALQLLAYLSKYPHVRQAFYKPRPSFHPATLLQGQSGQGQGQAVAAAAAAAAAVNAIMAGDDQWWATGQAGPSTAKPSSPAPAPASTPTTKETNPFLKAFASATGRGKEKEKAGASPSPSSLTASPQPAQPRMTNVFALVERFTYRPSTSELEGPNPPPTLPPEIQYWAGVIMRNACRKDDSRGGIRQCANMMCGKWESYPREFAKCRRCRKAKYCGKECQSIAWSEGHRFWCSAKDPDDDGEHMSGETSRNGASSSNAGNGSTASRTDRRARDAERQTRVVAEFAPRVAMNPSPLAQVAETVRPTTLSITTNTDQMRPRREPVDQIWGYSPVSVRRTRPRVDDAGTDTAGRAEVSVGAFRRQPGGTANTPATDVDLSPEVRRHLVQIIQGTRRPERVEVTTAPMIEAGPSRMQESGDDENGEEPMIMG